MENSFFTKKIDEADIDRPKPRCLATVPDNINEVIMLFKEQEKNNAIHAKYDNLEQV